MKPTRLAPSLFRWLTAPAMAALFVASSVLPARALGNEVENGALLTLAERGAICQKLAHDIDDASARLSELSNIAGSNPGLRDRQNAVGVLLALGLQLGEMKKRYHELCEQTITQLPVPPDKPSAAQLGALHGDCVRIETLYLQKVRTDWERATYVWSSEGNVGAGPSLQGLGADVNDMSPQIDGLCKLKNVTPKGAGAPPNRGCGPLGNALKDTKLHVDHLLAAEHQLPSDQVTNPNVSVGLQALQIDVKQMLARWRGLCQPGATQLTPQAQGVQYCGLANGFVRFQKDVQAVDASVQQWLAATGNNILHRGPKRIPEMILLEVQHLNIYYTPIRDGISSVSSAIPAGEVNDCKPNIY